MVRLVRCRWSRWSGGQGIIWSGGQGVRWSGVQVLSGQGVRAVKVSMMARVIQVVQTVPVVPMVQMIRVVSLDDMLSENIRFSCPKSSNNYKKVRCHACYGRTNGRKVVSRAVFF